MISPTDRTVPHDAERTIATPRFDEKSIQGARPAVPLTLRARARTWPTAVVVICVAAGLLGGVLGGVGLTFFQRGRSGADSKPVTQQQPAQAGDAQATRADPQTATATNAPAAQTEKTNGESAAVGGSAQSSNNAPAVADGSREPAGAAATDAASTKSGGDGASDDASSEPDAGTRGELQAALGEWVAATNARDVDRQMKFYAPTVNAFYLERNASRESVRAEKRRVFGSVDSVDVRASAPDIKLSRDGQTAVMHFRKQYRIGAAGRSGEVLQELRWRRTPSGWKIVSERDLRVLQ